MAKKEKTIKIFNDKKQVTKEIKDIIFDKAINNRFSSLKEYFKKEEIQYSEKSLEILIKKIEDKIQDQVAYYSFLMYHHMESTNKWGEPGEQQVKIAFCRNLLKVEPKRTLTQEDAVVFMTMVEEELQNQKIKAIIPADAQMKLKNYKFSLLGKQIESFKANEINRILQFIGSKFHFHGGQYGAEQEFILGEGKKVHKKGYDVIFLAKEIIRTPNNVMSMAAIIGNRNIYIRLESLKTIFAQKWLQMFNYSEDEKRQVQENPYWNVAEGIKQRVLKYYKVKKLEDLEKIEKTFIDDMAETILYHELGHGAVQHDMLPLELGAIGEATKLYGENIYTAVLEFLADFVPPKDKTNIGPLHNMINISKKDPDRASRMYFMYLSDTWFFNTEDQYMYTYSDLMALILLKYIQKDGIIDFKTMEADLQFREDRATKESLTLFERIFELYVVDVQEIKNITEHAKYTLMNQEFDYKKIRAILVEQFLKNDGYVHEDTYEFLVPFWTNMLGYIQQISDSNKKVQNYIENQQRKNLMKMMVLSCGRKKAENYNFDHRKYLVDRMKELGIKV